MKIQFDGSAGHWRPVARRGVQHGPQVWQWWRLVSFSVVNLRVTPPSFAKRLWIYTRWGALFGDMYVDRRPEEKANS